MLIKKPLTFLFPPLTVRTRESLRNPSVHPRPFPHQDKPIQSFFPSLFVPAPSLSRPHSPGANPLSIPNPALITPIINYTPLTRCPGINYLGAIRTALIGGFPTGSAPTAGGAASALPPSIHPSSRSRGSADLPSPPAFSRAPSLTARPGPGNGSSAPALPPAPPPPPPRGPSAALTSRWGPAAPESRFPGPRSRFPLPAGRRPVQIQPPAPRP